MKIKHHELEISNEDPFKNCKLDRKKYALVLTEIVNTYADGFVLAINNEWGTGKTTFVKMWQQHLINTEFRTIYFNAWENDYDSNPLVALLAELKSLNGKSGETTFKKVLKSAAVLGKSALPTIIKAIADKYIDYDKITEVIKEVTSGSMELFEKEVDEYITKRDEHIQFRKELAYYIQNQDSSKPVIFIIDELDRCRPDYAVEILEKLKHFFAVPGIVFVLSIDKNHLASAVKGFYGSENINTDEYLRRFIDLEYSIPEPSKEIFSKYLFDYYSFNDFFKLPERNHSELQNDADSLLKMAELLFQKSNTTLRQQEKIFGLTRLILKTFHPDNYTISHLLFFLTYLKVMQKDLFNRIELYEFSLQELSDMFTGFVPLGAKSSYSLNLIYIEAMLIHFYNNGLENDVKVNRLFKTDNENKLVTDIKSKLDVKNNYDISLASCLADIPSKRYGRMGLNYLIEKINLTTPLATI